MLPPDCRWLDVSGPCTPGWVELWRGGDKIAVVQPFAGGASIVFYRGQYPWQVRWGVPAARRRLGGT